MMNEHSKNDDTNRRLARIRDRNALRAFLEVHFARVKPNSDCSVEAWAHSALINMKAAFDEHADEIVEAFNNGYAAGMGEKSRREKSTIDYIQVLVPDSERSFLSSDKIVDNASIHRWLELECEKPHGQQRPVLIESLKIVLDEMAALTDKPTHIPYAVGEDVGEDD
jgi:predicted secreted protein